MSVLLACSYTGYKRSMYLSARVQILRVESSLPVFDAVLEQEGFGHQDNLENNMMGPSPSEAMGSLVSSCSKASESYLLLGFSTTVIHGLKARSEIQSYELCSKRSSYRKCCTN